MARSGRNIVALGYIVVGTTQIEAWKDFGANVLGAQPVGFEEELRFRLDQRPYRIIVARDESERLQAVGWEVQDPSSFEAIATSLDKAGIDYERASDADAFRRQVGGMLRLNDPSGNRLELYHSPFLDNSRFVSPAGVSSFVTGEQGLGHVVMPATAYDETTSFYTEILGFRLTDRMRIGAAEDGSGGMRLQFYHCNPRHHSLALMSAPHPAGLVHLMVEVDSIDEVGFALDRCLRSNAKLSATLGRHTNDQMISFYMKTPSGFDVEFGYGGLQVDLDTVSTSEITSVSDWGHDFSVGFRD